MIAMIAQQGTTGALGLAATLSGVLVALGLFLKHQTPLNPDWIPLVLLVLGMAAYLGSVWPPSVDSIITGLGVSLSAVGAYSGTKATTAAIKKPK